MIFWKLVIFFRLDRSRYFHSLRTANISKVLAKNYGLSQKKCYKAALLHDIAKNYSDSKLLELVSKYNISLSDFELNTLAVVHSKVGRAVLEYKFGVKYFDILQAVEFHSLGSKNMNDIAKVVFIADYIEEGRDFITDDFRKDVLAEKDVNRAVIMVYDKTFDYLRKKGLKLASVSVEAYDFFKGVIDEKK